MQHSDITPELLTDRSAAEVLGISRATLWKHAGGQLPGPVRIGGATRWRRDEIFAAIARATAARDGAAGSGEATA